MFEDEWDKIMAKYTEMAEKKTLQDLKDRGIIVDACLVLNSTHKGIEHELARRKIKRIPIVYSPYVEKDKCYMVTDKETVERIKQTVCFDFNKKCEGNHE